MKLKDTAKKVITLLNLMLVQFPYMKTILIVTGFCRVAPIFLNLFFSASILDFLMAQQYTSAVNSVIIMLLLSAFLNIMANYLQTRVQTYVQTGEEVITAQVADKAFRMDYQRFEDKKTMDAIRSVKNRSMGSGGIQALIEQIEQFIQSIFACLFSGIFLAYLFYQSGLGDLRLFLSIVLASIYIIYRGIKNSDKIKAAYQKMQASNVKTNSLSQYLINEHISVKNKAEIMINHLTNLFEKYYQLNFYNLNFYLEFGKYQGSLYGVYELLLALFSALTYLYVVSMTFQGFITIGSVLLYAGAIQQMSENISKSLTAFSYINFHMGYLEQYINFIDDQETLPSGSLPIEKRNDQVYEFTIKDVNFSYPDTEISVLEDINLTFKVGEKMAIVGRNGSGKTTLIKLLTRLYQPTKGQILLNGIDIQKYDFNEYTQIFAPVFQDFGTFAFSVAENIDFNQEVDGKRIDSVIERIGLTDRIAKLKDGLATKLENDNHEGVKFSGGESQKLAIARALYKDAPFVILDEPTAALDPFAEAEIYEQFDSLVQGKTTIYISHRMSSCRFCDRIVVLKGGQIIEDGNHQSLLDLQGEYYELYTAQAEYYQ